MAGKAAAEHLPDPDGVRAGIERYRELAKYLVTIFAGVGGLLVAGTQLSAIGDLSWEESRERILVAAAGFTLAIMAVAWIASHVLAVLKPFDLSLNDVVDDAALAADLRGRPELNGLESIEEMRDIINGPFLGREEREEWLGYALAAVDYAAFCLVRRRFERAWRRMLVGAFVTIVGIVAFTWAANPPAEPEQATHSLGWGAWVSGSRPYSPS